MTKRSVHLACLASVALALNVGMAVQDAAAQSEGLFSGLNNTTEPMKSTVLFFGAELEPHSYNLESGFAIALNGDISKNGFLFAGTFGFGEADWKFAGTKNNTDSYAAKALIGYQMYLDGLYVAALAGVDFQKNKTKPLAGIAKTDGKEFGFVVEGELETTAVQAPYFGIGGSYSTANNTFWTRGRVGYNTGSFKFGPEVTALGDKDTDTVRIGGFVSDIKLGMLNVGFSLGYTNESDGKRNDGAYGGVELTTEF